MGERDEEEEEKEEEQRISNKIATSVKNADGNMVK